MRLIFTDLDGTLIDHHTYSAEPALGALAACRAAGVPVVPCSSKTFAEMWALTRTLDLEPAPLLVENGSMVWFPPAWPAVPSTAGPMPGDAGGWRVVLGSTAAALAGTLPSVARAVDRTLQPLSGMSIDEVAARTGLAYDVARMAKAREYSQPFLVEGPDVPLTALDEAARACGARVTQGGRFFHLLGATDKGGAVGVVRATCPTGHRALGLGDAPNDLALLRAVDDPAIVPQPGTGVHPDVLRAVPQARRAPVPGPAGWSVVVLDWLSETAVSG